MRYLIKTKEGVFTVPDYLEMKIVGIGLPRSKAIDVLAHVAGVNKKTVWGWIGGKNLPNIERLEKIEKYENYSTIGRNV